MKKVIQKLKDLFKSQHRKDMEELDRQLEETKAKVRAMTECLK